MPSAFSFDWSTLDDVEAEVAAVAEGVEVVGGVEGVVAEREGERAEGEGERAQGVKGERVAATSTVEAGVVVVCVRVVGEVGTLEAALLSRL